MPLAFRNKRTSRCSDELYKRVRAGSKRTSAEAGLQARRGIRVSTHLDQHDENVSQIPFRPSKRKRKNPFYTEKQGIGKMVAKNPGGKKGKDSNTRKKELILMRKKNKLAAAAAGLGGPLRSYTALNTRQTRKQTEDTAPANRAGNARRGDLKGGAAERAFGARGAFCSELVHTAMMKWYLVGSKFSQWTDSFRRNKQAEQVKSREKPCKRKKGWGGHVRVEASSHCALRCASAVFHFSSEKKIGFHSPFRRIGRQRQSSGRQQKKPFSKLPCR